MHQMYVMRRLTLWVGERYLCDGEPCTLTAIVGQGTFTECVVRWDDGTAERVAPLSLRPYPNPAPGGDPGR
jgi:hypothetical protein